MSQRDGAADKVPARIVEGHGVAVPCGFPQVIAAGAVERRLRGRGRDRKREQHCGEDRFHFQHSSLDVALGLASSRIGSTLMPRSNRACDSRKLSSELPIITGTTAEPSLMPVFSPSFFRPSLKNFVFAQRSAINCGSSSRTSNAAMHAAATDGGWEVEKRKGRAR